MAALINKANQHLAASLVIYQKSLTHYRRSTAKFVVNHEDRTFTLVLEDGRIWEGPISFGENFENTITKFAESVNIPESEFGDWQLTTNYKENIAERIEALQREIDMLKEIEANPTEASMSLFV